MANSTRENAKREINRAVGCIDWAGTHLLRIVEIYKAQHPEVSDPLEQSVFILTEVQEAIKKVRDSF